MSEKIRFIFNRSIWVLIFMLFAGQHISAQDLFSTNFNNLNNWGGGSPTSYNEKFYEEGGWYFHSTEAVRGTADESYGGSQYSFRDRGVFSVQNTAAVAGMQGFSMQLRDWMLGSGENRNLKISLNGGNSWETIMVINKGWFDAYQTYQEYIYLFPDGAQNFSGEQFLIELDGGGSSNNGRINIGQFVALGESNAVIAPTFNPNGGTFFTPVDLEIQTVTPNAIVYYSMDSNTGPWTVYSTALSVAETTTIWAYATANDMDDSSVSQAIFTFPDYIEVTTLAALRDMPTDDNYYRFSGEAVIVAMDGFRNRKFIQDETAAILIDDNPGVISTDYDLYDVITDVIGELDLFNDMLRFQPVANTPPSTQNTPVDPAVFGLNEPTSNDQAKLIVFENVSFIDAGDDQTFANGTNYTITDGVHEFVLRTDFWNVDYIGESIPDITLNISGVLLQYQETLQIVPRFAADFNEETLSSNANLATFNLGDLNVLNLGGIVVNNPENDAGAILYLDDVDDFQGIEVVTAHDNASFTVTLNGNPLYESELDDQEISFSDVIIVEVVAENQTTTKFYKVTVLQDNRVLTILTPEEGDEFFTYDEVIFSWEAENLDQLILQLFVQGFADPFLTEIVNASDGQHTETVPNGLQFDFHYRLSDYNDPGFFTESGVFSYIDNVNPSLIDKYPEAGSIDIPLDASLFLEFNEFLINLGDGSFHIYKQQNDELVESILADGSQVEYFFNEVFVSFSENLEHATTYYILIDDNAIKDMADNYYAGIDDATYWTFTTKDEDTPDGLICNGDFENWTDGLPDCWYGDKSNIPASSVVQYSDNPYSGNHAVQLINTEGGHQRFTSQATQVESGITYNITFWVKGQGEIRTGLFDDRETGYGYAPYNQYVQVSSDNWSEHTQVVTAANTSGIAEFIFSVRNTGEAMNHLQLDNVSVVIHTDDPDEVASIAELRNGQIGSIYTLSGEAVITYQQSYRNQKFIQDGTAAIMIDDNSGIITTQYDQYDGITGLKGTLDIYNQMLQFIPIADPGNASSSNNIVNPEIVTLDGLNSAHQAKLVQVWNASFQDGGNFDTGQNYTLNSPNGTGVFRTAFFDADYIGTAIPSQPQIITAIVQQFNETMQITARSLDDFELFTNVTDYEFAGISIYPNPFNDQIHVSNADNITNIVLLNSFGQKIREITPPSGDVSITASQLSPGIYFVQIYFNNGQKIVKKLIKQ